MFKYKLSLHLSLLAGTLLAAEAYAMQQEDLPNDVPPAINFNFNFATGNTIHVPMVGFTREVARQNVVEE